MVELKVGPGDHAPIMVHEALLRHYSGYFEAALGGSFAESKSRIIELKDEDLDTVQHFVLWQYTKRFQHCEDLTRNFDAICRLWAFGDKRQIPLLCNVMINTFRNEIVKHWTNPGSTVKYTYDNTPPNSKLRAFVVWVIAATAGSGILTEYNRVSWPGDATFDLLRHVWQRKENNSANVTKQQLSNIDMCQWHQHEKDEKCTANPT